MIRTVDDILEGSCRTLCYMEPDCVSYNLKKAASENGKYKCELNNSTFEGQKHKLLTNSNYIYRGAKVRVVLIRCKKRYVHRGKLIISEFEKVVKTQKG